MHHKTRFFTEHKLAQILNYKKEELENILQQLRIKKNGYPTSLALKKNLCILNEKSNKLDNNENMSDKPNTYLWSGEIVRYIEQHYDKKSVCPVVFEMVELVKSGYSSQLNYQLCKTDNEKFESIQGFEQAFYQFEKIYKKNEQNSQLVKVFFAKLREIRLYDYFLTLKMI